MFGAFHILLSLICTAIAAAFAYALRHIPEERVIKILRFSGILLLLMEIYKQLYFFFNINNGVYDWWYFPFQLCSVPMYLCILLPCMKDSVKNASLTFMGTYTLISSVAALIYPEDFLRSQLSLTLHGFIWHGILFFISLLILFTGSADLSSRGTLRAGVLFLLMCTVAVILNILAEPVMTNAQGLSHSYAAMFYLNPYHLSPQPLVGTVQKSTSIVFGLVLYVLSIISASSLVAKIIAAFKFQLS